MFDIKKMMKGRDYHKKNMLLNTARTTTGYFIKLSARNKVNWMMCKAKSDNFRMKIDVSKVTDPKAGWKLINSLTGRGNKSSPAKL